MPGKEYIQQQLKNLKATFAATLPERIDQMVAGLDALASAPNPSRHLEDTFRQIHSLSGSAGSFGFNRLGEQLRQIELSLKGFINQHTLPDSRLIASLSADLQQLHALIAKGADHEAAPGTSHGPLASLAPLDRPVYIVEDDSALGDNLCLHLKQHGFKPRLFSSVSKVKIAIAQEKPAALVLDIMLPEGSLAGTDFAATLDHTQQESIPVLFMSARADWASRLAAVQAGGTAYLNKPVDVSLLLERLNRITQRVEQEPYRVLLLDDSQDLVSYYSLVLRQAGMHTAVLTEPSNVLDKLESFKPELILLDFHLPGISGLEIAHVIRQHQVHFSIPIVFLSSETDRDIQLTALQQGDDFLKKPIPDAHLVSAATSRIERSRELSRLMYYHGLTGLLNQLALKRRLESELARSQRQGYQLSYVMIDIDLFKLINDNYGHLTGDQVLKSLARMLKERLRKSDQIGRYGGEEFGIIMPDTDANSAHAIVDDIRSRFAQLVFQSDDQKFSCSFSAGIASAEMFNQDKPLIEAADEALYQAKDNGRNQVVLHEACQS